MSIFSRPFDAGSRLGGCTCGAHTSQAEHDAQIARELLTLALRPGIYAYSPLNLAE